MSASDGVATLINYAALPTNGARVAAFEELLPKLDVNGNILNKGMFDEMSPAAAAQLKTDVNALGAALSSGDYNTYHTSPASVPPQGSYAGSGSFLTPPVTMTATPNPVSNYAASNTSGTTVFTISNVPAGATPVLASPNDGRFVIGGSQAAGWKLVQGLSAISANPTPIQVRITAPGANDLVVPVTVVSAASPLYMAAGNRVMTNHDTATVSSAATQFKSVQQGLGFALWDGYAPRSYIMNARDTNGRLAYNPNAWNIEKAGYLVVAPGGFNVATGAIDSSKCTFIPVTFGGSTSYQVPVATTPTTAITMHDALPDSVTIAKGSYVLWQMAINFINATDSYVGIVSTGSSYSPLFVAGDAGTSTTSSQIAKIGAPITNTTAYPIPGVNGFFMKGCPSTKDVYMFMGDSIGQGGNPGQNFGHVNGIFGGFKQALDSASGGGQKSFWDVSTFSDGLEQSSPVTYGEASGTPSKHWVYLRVSGMLGNVPFTRIANQNGHNNTSLTLSGMQDRLTKLVNWCKTNYNHTRWIHFSCSYDTTQSNNSYWTDTANQAVNATAPSGTPASNIADNWNAYLAAGAGGQVDYYIPHHTAVQNVSTQKWKTNDSDPSVVSSVTLAAAVAAGSSSPSLSAAIAQGSMMVYEPTDASNAEDGGLIHGPNGVDASNFPKYYLVASNGYGKTFAKAHGQGVTVKEKITVDGTHLTAHGHAIVRDFIINNHKAAAFT